MKSVIDVMRTSSSSIVSIDAGKMRRDANEAPLEERDSRLRVDTIAVLWYLFRKGGEKSLGPSALLEVTFSAVTSGFAARRDGCSLETRRFSVIRDNDARGVSHFVFSARDSPRRPVFCVSFRFFRNIRVQFPSSPGGS